jgi:phosphoglycolate phosphatase
MLRVYRQDYRRDGAFDAAIFPGVVSLLGQIRAAGIPLAVATSKSEGQAVRILEHFKLNSLFAVIRGASEDETRSTKALIVAEALSDLRKAGHDFENPVLIGDRIYDVEGAITNGIPAIIVNWGYGFPEEAAAALATVDSTDELRALLLG